MRRCLTAPAQPEQRARASSKEAVVDLTELVQNDLGTDVGRKQFDGLAPTERRARDPTIPPQSWRHSGDGIRQASRDDTAPKTEGMGSVGETRICEEQGEDRLAKAKVAGSNPVFRSNASEGPGGASCRGLSRFFGRKRSLTWVNEGPRAIRRAAAAPGSDGTIIRDRDEMV